MFSLVAMNTNLKWTGGNGSANPTRHVCHLPLYSSLASPESMFSFTSHVSTIRSCQKCWPKPEAGPPLCRRMSSFVTHLGILRAWGRPRSSCVDARLETNHYTADDRWLSSCSRQNVFCLSENETGKPQGSLGVFLSSEGSAALWLENWGTLILSARGLVKAQR